MGYYLPVNLNINGYVGGTFNALALNAATNGIGLICQAPADASITITHLLVTVGSIVGTSPSYRISIQGVTTAGKPDGTVKGGGSPASATFAPSVLGWSQHSCNEVALSNSYATTAGEIFSIVVDYSSGTIGGSNYINAYYNVSPPLDGMPYGLDLQTTWNKRNGISLLGYKTASHVYGFPSRNFPTGYTFNSSSSPKEYGARFTLVEPSLSTYMLYGIRWLGDWPGGTFALRLYSGGNASDVTVLQSKTGIGENLSSSANRVQEILFAGSLATLSFGSTYRVTLLPETSSSSIGMNTLPFTSATHMEPFFGKFVQDSCLTKRTTGNWTDTTLETPYMQLLIGNLAAAAGGAINPFTSTFGRV